MLKPAQTMSLTGTVACYWLALDPVWQVGSIKAGLMVLEAAYIILQEQQEGRISNSYFEQEVQCASGACKMQTYCPGDIGIQL